MGTRTRIGIIHKDESITSIYTHWDGYPAHHWPLLTQHYKTPAKVQKLLALGCLSLLDQNIGKKIGFDDHEAQKKNEQCVAYGRDRNDCRVEASDAKDLKTFRAQCQACCAEFAYLFDGNVWSAYSVRYPDGKLVLLDLDADGNEKVAA